MDPTHLQSYRVLAQSYLAAGEIGEALDTLTIYLAHEKYDGEAYTWLGLCHEARDEQALAFDAYSRAIKLDAKQPAAYLQRGLIYFDREEFEQAKSDLVRALALDKHSFVLNITLGQTYLILEEYGNAYQKFSECEAYAEGDEDWAQIYFWRAQALENLDGQATVARKNWSNLLKLPEDTYPEEWKEIAEEHLGRVATFTRTPTLTRTVTPTRTPTPKP
jgi:tetratricopeptide (TPR) repeat protein